jgi:hypothetical protein
MMALYDHVQWIRIVLLVSFALSYVVIGILLGPTFKDVWGSITYFPLTNICLLPDIPSFMYAVYLAPSAFDVLVIVLTIVMAYENAAILRSRSNTPIVCSTPIHDLELFLTLTNSYTP